jgi:AcrR family transcriptional regulator
MAASNLPSATQKSPEGGSGKRHQILTGARAAFAELGFERATVDDIAARAGVSKATVYNHFHDKRALFIATFDAAAEGMRAELKAVLAEPSNELERTLQRVGERIISIFVSPAALALQRNISSELARFPELGPALYERGPRLTIELLEGFLVGWAGRGLLRLDDPHVAAVHLVMLCESDLVTRVRLGVTRPTPQLITASVRQGVETFLRAYRAPPRPDGP